MLQRGGFNRAFNRIAFTRIMTLLCCLTALALVPGCSTSSGSIAGPNGSGPRFYIVDTGNSRIIRTDDFSGTNWISFGALGSTASGNDYLDRPTGIAFDSTNRMYIVDSGNNRIVRSDDFTGTNWTVFGTTGVGVNQFTRPMQIAIDPSNNIYITDSGNNRIVRITDMTGTGWTTLGALGAGTGQFNFPTGIYLDAQNRIYIADTNNNRIVRMNDITGAGWTALGSLGVGTNQFNSPSGITMDALGVIYVTDTGNSRIVHMTDLTGANWTAFGTTGVAQVAEFNYPTAITVYNYTTTTNKVTTTTPYIYIVDTGNSRVLRYGTLADTNPHVIGLPGADVYEFSSPQGIVIHK